jgi:hypothetical protein
MEMRVLLKFAAWCAARGRPMFEEEPKMKSSTGGLADATAPDFVEQLTPIDGAEDEALDLELGDCTTPEYQQYLAELEAAREKRLKEEGR